MHHKNLLPHSTTHLHALQEYIKAMDNTLAHLNHVIGSEIRQLDKIMTKTGAKPITKRKPRVLHASSAFSSQHLQSILRSSVNGAVGRELRQQQDIMGTLSTGVDSRMSNGQLLADLTSAITRTIARNL